MASPDRHWWRCWLCPGRPLTWVRGDSMAALERHYAITHRESR